MGHSALRATGGGDGRSDLVGGGLARFNPAGMRRVRRVLLVPGAAALLVAGCMVQPKPLSDAESDAQAVADRQAMFGGQEPLNRPLTLSEAYARALKYNLDRRAKLMEQAVAYDGLVVGNFDLLPKLTADAGYLTRNSTDASSSRSIATGAQSLVPSTALDNNRLVADLTLSWNILDFGVSYFAARQQANRALIAMEHRRKVAQNLLQDVRSAFWRAASAQALGGKIDAAIHDADEALERSRRVESEGLRAPLDALRYQRTLLDLLRQLESVRQKLQLAKTDLAALINIPPGQDFLVRVPAAATMTYEPLQQSVASLEQVAMMRNPDLRELRYEARISVDETRKSMLKLLPGINLSYAGNYDSNSFLVNHWWAEGAERVSWNLLNLASAPAVFRLNADSEKLADLRRQAVAMAVLAKLHIAYEQYVYIGSEYRRARDLSRVDRRIYAQVSNRTAADAQSVLERVAAEVYAANSELRQYETYADLQAALGRVYATLGFDPEPAHLAAFDVSTLSSAVDYMMSSWKQAAIAPDRHAAPPRTGDADGGDMPGLEGLRRSLYVVVPND
jgi:outer membrane protein TolC